MTDTSTQTKDNEVYQHLRERILRNTFRPGERLREEELCRQLNVTRTPLRLALRRLEHERLVTGEPYRGCRVREVHREEVGPLFDMREMLEGLAARNVAEKADARALKVLSEMAQACDEAGHREEWTRYFEWDRKLHWEIVQRAANETLVEVMEVCNFQLRTFALHDRYLLLVVEQLRARASELEHNHRELVETLASGNPGAAEAKMRAHIRLSKEIVMQACSRWHEQEAVV